MWTEISEKIVVLGEAPADAEAIVLYNRAYVARDKTGLDQADFVDVQNVAAKLWAAKVKLDNRFSDIGEQTSMAMLALACSEHAFYISPPGTGKTSIVKGLGQAISGTYWSIQINQETTPDHLLGPIDSEAYTKSGRLTRKWAGLATSSIVLLDEIWKGEQVSNYTLEPLEERKLAIGDEILTMPLITALAASNEMPRAAFNAALDRFLFRQVVSYIRPQDTNEFKAMFTAPGLRKPMKPVVSEDEVRILAAAIDALSMNMPEAIVSGCIELARILEAQGLEFGPRRWIRTAKAAIGWALLHGEQPNLSHLCVARWTLWNDPEEAAQVEELVLGATDPYAGAVLTFKGNFAEITRQLNGLGDDAELTVKAEFVQKLMRLKSEIQTVSGDPQAAKYQSDLANLASQADQAVMAAMS